MEPARRNDFFASGIGITPILPMIEPAHAQGLPWRLNYVGRMRSRLAHLDRLEKYEENTVHITQSKVGQIPTP